MLHYKSNKKCIAYYPLIVVVSILLSMSYYLVNSDFTGYATFDENFEITKTVDKINSKRIADEFYIKNYVEKFSNQLKSKILIDEISWKDKEIDPENYNTCMTLEGNRILYNEKFIDSQKRFNSGGDDLSNQIEQKVDSCFPTFEEEFKIEFINTLKQNFEDEFQTLYEEEGYELKSINIAEDEINSAIYSIGVNSDFSKEIQLGEQINNIKTSNSINFKKDFSSYFELIKTLETELPKLSKKIKNEVPSCINGGKEKNICITSSFKDLMSSVSRNYGFEIEVVPIVDSEYYILDIVVNNKNTKINELKFSVILKENLPKGKVDFSLSPFKGYNDVIDVEINKQLEGDTEVPYYIILYSYQNFLDKNIYGENYETLKSMLDNSQVPNNFEKKTQKLWYSPNLGLSLIVVNSNEFNKNKNKFHIHQIYDGGSFKILEEKEIYVAVFAVDEGYYYSTDDESLDLIKSIIPEKQFGPSPITESEIYDVTGSEESFQFTVKLNRVSETPTDFELLVMRDRKIDDPIQKNCDGVDFMCESVKLSDVDGNILVTSSITSDTSSYNQVITISNLNLLSEGETEFVLIPLDKNGLGNYKDYSINYYLNQFDDYYTLNNVGEAFNLERIKTFKVDIKSLAPTIQNE